MIKSETFGDFVIRVREQEFENSIYKLFRRGGFAVLTAWTVAMCVMAGLYVAQSFPMNWVTNLVVVVFGPPVMVLTISSVLALNDCYWIVRKFFSPVIHSLHTVCPECSHMKAEVGFKIGADMRMHHLNCKVPYLNDPKMIQGLDHQINRLVKKNDD